MPTFYKPALSFAYLVFLFISLTIFQVSCRNPGLKTEKVSGKVISISDGDTFRLLKSDNSIIKVRIANIDCPERKQPFSAKATQLTSKLIFEKNVTLNILNKDKYGRSVAEVKCKGKNVGEELLANGLAWHFVRYSSNAKLQALEDKAKKKKLGLWYDKKPIPPWDWRRGVR